MFRATSVKFTILRRTDTLGEFKIYTDEFSIYTDQFIFYTDKFRNHIGKHLKFINGTNFIVYSDGYET